MREKNGHMIVGWDPTAKNAITDAAQAAYLASGLQNQAGMPATLSVLGGPIYAGDSGVSQPAEAMWMPRVSASYLLGARTVLKGGYGLYYDTLTAADYFAAQAGYSVTTTSTISDDQGRTFKWPTPATGSASFDPFPVRADGTRWDPVLGDTLGLNTVLGGAPDDRKRPAQARPAAALARGDPAGAARRISPSKSPTRAPSTTVCRSASAATTCRSSTGTAATRGTPRRTRS